MFLLKNKRLQIFLSFIHVIVLNQYMITAAVAKHYQSTSEQGLYNASDHVTNLNVTTFKSTVYGSSTGWLIEFYSSWCGFCIRYAPIWKELSNDIYNWRDIVVVAAIDCAAEENTPVCRDYEIMKYPTIKYFPLNVRLPSLGIEVEKGSTSDAIRNSLVETLEREQQEGRGSTWPNITPYRNAEVTDVWKTLPDTVVYFFLLFERPDSQLGAEVILDMHNVNIIQIRRVISDNELLCVIHKITKFPSLISYKKDGPQESVNIKTPSREGIRRALKEHLLSKGLNIESQIEVDYNVKVWTESVLPSNVSKIDSGVEKEDTFDDKLYQMDLENTLQYSLKHEIPLHKSIKGQKLEALLLYLEVIADYFPFHKNSNFTKIMHSTLLSRNHVTGNEFRQLVESIEKISYPFTGPHQWIGCKGSSEIYRGYPCGLWTMFHTLSVNFALKTEHKIQFEPNKILKAMHGYIKFFFGCADCSDHFIDMASKKKIFRVSSTDESLVWLWEAHNQVNQRLSGDETEDPAHKKIQYPAEKHCPTCRYNNGTWNKNEILKYLKMKYSYDNIDYYGTNDSYIESRDNGMMERLVDNTYMDSKKIGWDFTIFDISICVVLYIASATILILVCVKFAIRRNFRKKCYVSLLGKV